MRQYNFVFYPPILKMLRKSDTVCPVWLKIIVSLGSVVPSDDVVPINIVVLLDILASLDSVAPFNPVAQINSWSH